MASSSKSINKTTYVTPKLKDFVFTEKLGSGTYATVYKAYRKSCEHRQVIAVKCIQKSNLNRVSIENLLLEIEILKQIKHEHVVELFDFQWDDSFIYLIMEYCGGGDLSGFIQSKRMIPEYTVRRFLQQIASAVKVLHDHNISHMDLKPQNILLTSNYQPVLKIADFGFAQHIESVQEYSLRGSPLYMAPEMILMKKYDAKVDLWSIGVILYESLFGEAPFASRTLEDLEAKIQSQDPILVPRTPQTSNDCKNLLYGLLRRDPDQRISFEDFFAHPFVDLEHKPSQDCLPKATEIVMSAVASDRAGDLAKAAKLYSEAIEYFVPAIYYENDQLKKAALRTRVTEYCNRAEQLKILSKPVTTPTDSLEQLKLLSEDNQVITEAIQMIFEARKAEKNDKFQQALDLYTEVLGNLIPILGKEKPTRRKELLHSQVQFLLTRAESIRSYVSVQEIEIQQPNVQVENKPTKCSIS
nr:serine/threonine-protein kinase ULK3 [Ciona intestinalis]|eukprot:XP_002128179.1 serine/threonine-protein kinase ULK3 [Ciona intestinalis]